MKTQVVIDVTINDANGPIQGVLVDASIIVDSGVLTPDQVLTTSGWSGVQGQARLAFNGILGDATVHFAVSSEGVQLCASPTYRVFTVPKLCLQVESRSVSPCQKGPAGPPGPCSAFNTSGSLRAGYDVYLVVAQLDAFQMAPPSNPPSGFNGLDFGIRYGSGLRGVTWTTCNNSGMDWTFGDWPASGGSIAFSWPTCSNTVISTEEGVHALAGVFYVYAYADDQLEITPDYNNAYRLSQPGPLLYPCDGIEFQFPENAIAKARFSAGGDTPGVNPCLGSGPPLPPPPPPPPPVWNPDMRMILLHVGPASGGDDRCASGPASPQDVVTQAEATPEGMDYFVYLLATPSNSVTPDHLGVNGLQVGIDYDRDTPERRGVKVESWHPCSELDFPGTDWPAPGTGNTMTWSLGNCQDTPIVTAGYFHVTAYGPSVMSVTSFPPTGLVKVANCAGAEVILDQVLGASQVGWISLGGGAIGPDRDGCNPALEPCVRATPTIPITWGQLKQRYLSPSKPRVPGN